MGRVARFKKIRACDPYSRENKGRVVLDRVGVWGLGDNGRKPKKRSLVAQRLQARKLKRRNGMKRDDEGFDLPPQDEDDFDTGTFVVQKKTKPLSLEDVEAAVVQQSPREAKKEESRINKLLKIDAQVVPVPEKLPGESKGAYRKRVHAETRQIINETKQSKRSGKKKEKKKEFLRNKKLKKRGLVSVSGDGNEDNGSDYDDLDKNAGPSFDAPKFGEQAERPPEFRALPRGAARKQPDPRKTASTKKRKSMDDDDVAAEQQAMQAMRKKVQAQYALVRQKRRGEFHL